MLYQLAARSNPGRALAIAAIALAATLVAACGGSASTPGPVGTIGPAATRTSAETDGGGTATDDPGNGATVDACGLLSDSDIEEITGWKPTSESSGPQFGIFESGCEWELASDTLVPSSIVLGVMTSGGRQYYDTYFKPFNDEQGYTPIPGLGDEAVDAGASSVLAVGGDAFINVQYIEFPEPEGDVQVELARRILENLRG